MRTTNKPNLAQANQTQLPQTPKPHWIILIRLTSQGGNDALSEDESAKKKELEPSEQTNQLADGTFSIESAAAEGKVIDAKGGSTANGTRAQSYETNGTDAQVWRVETSDNGITTIYHATSGKVLDVVSGNAYAGAVVQLWESNGTNAQKWRLVCDGEMFKIVSLLDESLVLDLAGARTINGIPIQLWNDNGTLAQRWRFSAAETVRQRANRLASENVDVLQDGTYSIATLLSGKKVIDVPGASYTSGSNLGYIQITARTLKFGLFLMIPPDTSLSRIPFREKHSMFEIETHLKAPLFSFGTVMAPGHRSGLR